MHRQPQYILLIPQPGQKRRGEPAPGNRVRCRRRDHPTPARALTPTPIPQPPVHHPGNRHLPVDLLTGLKNPRIRTPARSRRTPAHRRAHHGSPPEYPDASSPAAHAPYSPAAAPACAPAPHDHEHPAYPGGQALRLAHPDPGRGSSFPTNGRTTSGSTPRPAPTTPRPGHQAWRPDPQPAQPVHASTPRQRHHRSQARKARPPGHTITINHTTSHARRAANNPQPAAAPLHTHRTHTTGRNQPPHGITEYLRIDKLD